MSTYREWFRFTVEHAYHAGGLDGWRALPDAPTRRLLDGAGVLLRQAAGAVVVLAPDGRRDLLPARDEDGAPLSLRFEIRVDDPLFGAYTSPQPAPGQVLLADSRQAVREASGAWRLHAGEWLGDAALAPDAPRPPGLPRPALTLRIAPPPLETADPEPAPRYVVRLAAASSYWKYYLLDALAGRALSIVDVDDEVAFTRLDGADLDGRKAAVFMSDRALALRARSPRRFQLREQAAFGDKVLVKRLPVACAGIRRKAQVDGHDVLVSEIFVNY